jgi:hypothetical protein
MELSNLKDDMTYLIQNDTVENHLVETYRRSSQATARRRVAGHRSRSDVAQSPEAAKSSPIMMIVGCCTRKNRARLVLAWVAKRRSNELGASKAPRK